MAMSPEVRAVLQPRCLLGEGVVWDAGRALVWFVDIKRHHLWRYDPRSGEGKVFEAPGQIGWALPTTENVLLCGLQDGLYLFDPAAGDFRFLMTLPGERAGNRLNDACTDPWGRVWFGSMDDSECEASGCFYVFDRGEVRPAGPEGITITNGPAVNRPGDRIYFTDTLARTISVAPLGPDGVGEARLFVDVSAHFPDAYPDGPVVDAEEHVWTALYRGGHVARFTPDGRLVAAIPCPARDVTKLAFGGSDLATCYVTSATKDLDERDGTAEAYPLAGSLFAFDAPVRGFPQPLVRLA